MQALRGELADPLPRLLELLYQLRLTPSETIDFAHSDPNVLAQAAGLAAAAVRELAIDLEVAVNLWTLSAAEIDELQFRVRASESLIALIAKLLRFALDLPTANVSGK